MTTASSQVLLRVNSGHLRVQAGQAQWDLSIAMFQGDPPGLETFGQGPPTQTPPGERSC